MPAASRAAKAQANPTRPIRILVSFPVDTFARLMGQWLSGRLGQPVIIDWTSPVVG
jgi:tripartite-type tricarboxylate transporter receptor subunit TctC